MVGLLLRQFSKLVVSATHPPLQGAMRFGFAVAKVRIIFILCKFLLQIFIFNFKNERKLKPRYFAFGGVAIANLLLLRVFSVLLFVIAARPLL